MNVVDRITASLMNSQHDVDIVLGFAELGDLAGLQKFTPANFDWSRAGTDLRPPLHLAIAKGIGAPLEKRDAYVKVVEWIIQSGADPQQRLSQNCRAFTKLCGQSQDLNIQVEHKGRSAISLVFALLKAYKQYYLNDSPEISFLEAILFVISSRSVPRRAKLEVDTSVVERWQGIRGSTSTHNVTLETADGPVTAHHVALMVASPVLSAMLSSAMTEGTSKRIDVKDSSAAGVSLFLDIVYMSGTSSDPDYKTVLAALDLSHRWQVNSVVLIFEEMLEGMITSSTFPEIAETAVLKGLRNLERACSCFAGSDTAVQALGREGKLHPCVMKLLRQPQSKNAEEPSPKRLRTF